MIRTRDYVIERALALFEGNAVHAHRWLAEANRALNWIAPEEMLSSPAGIDRVLKLIAQLEHGVYP
ncbi:TPA: antitoxin Xre/MbcA/ParS toxin-binding domain-containing protein [Escherichia coli]|nr:DUF2384 domain-containing protein [Escherichia coli]HBC5705825.1 DUF2384 domain-containing protein [Escherichia coli]HCL8302411.1 DUF2384 domain-containing protein [Escherichia coli]